MKLIDAHTHRVPHDPEQTALVDLLPGSPSSDPDEGCFYSCGIHPRDLGRFTSDELVETLCRIPCSAVRRFLKVLVQLGLDGLEAYYPVFTARQTAMLNEMAQEFGILRTGGTDYHGEEVHPGIKLGIGTGDLSVPDDLLPPMLEKLERVK